ncbi:MAG: hypothetical protein P4K86_00525 [Terracidiphilus sp.]|nr:hypothetical protein [Terracidiphilus sp.]MDR3776030.1 hypothetical protein [Terracidiphilus sp.]
MSADTRLEQIVLVLNTSASKQAELDAMVEVQHDPQSSFYHRWLTPAEYGARSRGECAGNGSGDRVAGRAWILGQRNTGEQPAHCLFWNGRTGGDKFHTELHRYRVDGMTHLANSESPQVPAALAGVVEGIVSLHDFRRTPAMTGRRALGARHRFGSGRSIRAAARIICFPPISRHL